MHNYPLPKWKESVVHDSSGPLILDNTNYNVSGKNHRLKRKFSRGSDLVSVAWIIIQRPFSIFFFFFLSTLQVISKRENVKGNKDTGVYNYHPCCGYKNNSEICLERTTYCSDLLYPPCFIIINLVKSITIYKRCFIIDLKRFVCV